MEDSKYIAKAFLSCSLRKKDRDFVDFVANILKHYQIEPFGTVGLLDSTTESPSSLMRANILKADIVVVIATKRYLTTDNHFYDESNAISEMLHTEAGIAYALSKPVVVFVKEGTNVGNFLPSITQYISLDGSQSNLDTQNLLIKANLNSAIQKVEESRRKRKWDELGRIFVSGLAIYGGITIFNNAQGEKEEE